MLVPTSPKSTPTPDLVLLSEPYFVDFIFDEDFALREVYIKSRRGEGIFTTASLRKVLGLIRSCSQ